MKSYLPLIFGMMIVTFIPRLLPFIILPERPLPPLLRRFLTYIPYTALGALIVRGIMQAPFEDKGITITGICVAAICSWFKGGLILSVIAAIIFAFIMLTIMG